jgi:hypothetical protein
MFRLFRKRTFKSDPSPVRKSSEKCCLFCSHHIYGYDYAEDGIMIEYGCECKLEKESQHNQNCPNVTDEELIDCEHFELKSTYKDFYENELRISNKYD